MTKKISFCIQGPQNKEDFEFIHNRFPSSLNVLQHISML